MPLEGAGGPGQLLTVIKAADGAQHFVAVMAPWGAEGGTSRDQDAASLDIHAVAVRIPIGYCQDAGGSGWLM